MPQSGIKNQKMKNKIVKGMTVTLFLTLITSFVAYRSGYLGRLKSSNSVSPNGNVLNNQTDTIPKNDSLKKLEIISSSKVLILREHSLEISDSSKVKIDSSTKIDPMIYSSKSGIILKPEDLKKIKQDSIAIDSLKKQ